MSDEDPRDSRWFLRERVHEGLRPVGRAVAAAGESEGDTGRRVNTFIRSRLLQQLQRQFGPILTPRRSCDELATALARLEAPDQQRVLEAVAMIADTDLELAFAFAGRAARALAVLDDGGFQAWLSEFMDAFDRRGLGAGLAAVEDLEAFAARRRALDRGMGFEQVVGRLRPFVLGLGGRALELRADAQAWTDTDALYLPELIDTGESREACAQLYHMSALYLWAQTWFGTWRLQALEGLLAQAAGPAAVPAWAALEHVRLGACISRELPGAGRRLAQLAAGRGVMPAGWETLVAPLREPGADAHDSLQRIDAALAIGLPPPACYEGVMRPERVDEVLRARLARERLRLQVALGRLQQEQDQVSAPDPDQAPAWRNAGRRFTLAAAQAGRRSNHVELELDGAPVAPPAEARGAIAEILQDLGEVPDDYLVASAPNRYGADGDAGPGEGMAAGYQALFDESGVFRYPEWDHARGRFRLDYCQLRESDVEPVFDDFVQRTRERHAGALKSIRRSFEALITCSRVERRQRFGDDVDVDALVEARADLALGRELSDQVYLQLRDYERSLAAMFMVDMSGSTKGWVNEAEREALVLLCEALAPLKDRHAIYGFSGRTHKRCETYRVKTFDEPYDDTVRARISGIRPKGYTRMGAAIRHLSGILAQQAARTRVLITLSDGKPEDYRSYRGRYGIEDTRHALLEARRAGIHAFCITIDQDAGDYLPHMYGPANYALVNDVARLPVKVADIYRRLTT